MKRLKRNALYFSSFIGGCVAVGVDLRPASIWVVVLVSALFFNFLLDCWWVER